MHRPHARTHNHCLTDCSYFRLPQLPRPVVPLGLFGAPAFVDSSVVVHIRDMTNERASLDLASLQQQLQKHRSSLSDAILSHLPSPSASSPPAPKQSPVDVRRPATLGVGATTDGGKSAPIHPSDQKFRAKLGARAGQKREHASSSLNEPQDGSDLDEDADTRSSVPRKKAPQKTSDIFAAAEAKAKAAHTKAPPRPVPPDLATMSKAQRKKWNKRQRIAESVSNASDKTPSLCSSQSPPNALASSEPSPVPTQSIASGSGEVAQNASTQLDSHHKVPVPLPESSSSSSSSSSMTPLQSSMLASLQGARFRSINERLYTHHSSDALAFMKNEPQLFDDYHAGFRQQVRKWPTNPVDRIADLLIRTKKSHADRYLIRASNLPGALIVDLGAGEGGLAKKLAPHGFHILSYDLVTTADGWVRGLDAAAIDALPLPGVFAPLGLVWHHATSAAMVDVAIFCLSLMGTNWVHMICEAWRVLKPGGELVIAEVSSRFGSTGETLAFTELVRALGFHLDWQDSSNTHFVLLKLSKTMDYRQASQEALSPIEHTMVSNTRTKVDPLALRHAVAQPAQAQDVLDLLVRSGAQILKPCLYKRR